MDGWVTKWRVRVGVMWVTVWHGTLAFVLIPS